MGEPKPEWKGLLSRSRWPLALIISPITPPSPRQPPAFFFLLFDDSFLFLVWMPSFFIVSGRFTCKSRSQQFVESIGFNLNVASGFGEERLCRANDVLNPGRGREKGIAGLITAFQRVIKRFLSPRIRSRVNSRANTIQPRWKNHVTR